MTAEIRDFFDRYRQAFNRLDGEAVARLFAVPSGIAHGGSYTHWGAFEPVRDNMVRLCELYRANGFREARFEEAAFIAQGEDFAVADLSWHIDRLGDLPPWTFNTSYNLMRTAAGWKVLLCTAYEEQRLH